MAKVCFFILHLKSSNTFLIAEIMRTTRFTFHPPYITNFVMVVTLGRKQLQHVIGFQIVICLTSGTYSLLFHGFDLHIAIQMSNSGVRFC